MSRRSTAALLLPALALPLATAAPAQAATEATCRGTVVARADIDGDAKRDTVTITKLVRGGDQPVHRLCVKTATGKVSSIVDTAEWQFYDDPALYGVAGMDGNRGNEIILRAGYGAHTLWFHVFRWSNGRLVRQNAPETRQAGWTVDSAVWVAKGYRFYTKRGVRYLVESTGLKDGNQTTFNTVHTTYRWKNDSWQRLSKTRSLVRPGTAAHDAVVGWHGISVPMGY